MEVSGEAPRTGKRLAAFLFVLIIILLIAGGYLYNNINNQIKSLKDSVTDKNGQITSLNQSINELKSKNSSYKSSKGTTLIIYTPLVNAKVTSPLIVMGQAPGSWSFEGSFPVQLKDAAGNIITSDKADLLKNWMTSGLVPFKAALNWDTKQSGAGWLVLKKDNPSGQAQNDDSVNIAINF